MLSAANEINLLSSSPRKCQVDVAAAVVKRQRRIIALYTLFIRGPDPRPPAHSEGPNGLESRLLCRTEGGADAPIQQYWFQ